MHQGVTRLHVEQTAAIVVQLANCHRDIKEHPEPYTLRDVLKPRRKRRRRRNDKAIDRTIERNTRP